jgi:hypothetical protein
MTSHDGVPDQSDFRWHVNKDRRSGLPMALRVSIFEKVGQLRFGIVAGLQVYVAVMTLLALLGAVW